ncbi:MAG: hypothetical protein LQ338_008007 [Usnochroma carphineum]|nr:MAG: hypothetical protein LQ338_008007 [Usnochroma carphineum]
MDAAGQQIHLRSPPRSDQTFAGSTGLTPDTQLALSVDSKAVPRHIFQTAIGGSMLPAELLGDYYIRKSYGPLTAELPSDGYYDNRQPPELDGSTLHTNVAYQWSPSKPTSSDHNAFSGLPWHPKFPVAAKACLPAYTQQPQHMDFPVSYRRDGSPIQTLRSDSGEMALPLFAELDSTMATDTSGPNRPHRSLKAQYGSILDELFVPIYPNADVQNLSQSNEVQSFCSGTTLVQDQLSQQEAPWSPMSSSYLQTGDSEKLQLPSRPSYSGSTPTQESSLSLRIADLALSSHGQAAGDTWGQCFYPAASGSQYAYKAPEDRDETAFESPLPMRLGFAHKEAAPNTSPTESTLSSHRESHGMRSYSNTTLPTSAETSPTSARKPPNISLEAQVPQPRIPGTSKCDSCDTMFTGSFQDRRSNLNRHRKYQHEQQEKFKCLEEGCNKEYSRPDNLRKHCQADHPGAQQLRRRNAHKVRRNF